MGPQTAAEFRPAFLGRRAQFLRFLSAQPRAHQITTGDRLAARKALGLSGKLRGVRRLHRLPALPLQLYARRRADPAVDLRRVRHLSRGPRISAASQTPPDPLRPPRMQRLTLERGIPESLRGSVVALGNFDGFHLGHQAVVGRAVARAFHERRRTIVATFDPHPVRFFKPDVPPFRLTTLDQRETLFAHAGADAMLVFEFGEDLRSTSAEDFVTELLASRLGAAGAVTRQQFTSGEMPPRERLF